MKIKLPINIHNKYRIEVKNIETNEIQLGYAENIVLTHTLTSGGLINSNYTPSDYIAIGDGTGILSADRTTLFSQVARIATSLVEFQGNQVPDVSYCTKKAVIAPSELVGITITEVGLSSDAIATTNVYTHAFIKDSEGNQLVLGPKTALQEITIYSTVYFQPNFETGITLAGSLLYDEVNYRCRVNALLLAGTMANKSEIAKTVTSYAEKRVGIYTNGGGYAGLAPLNVSGSSWVTPTIRLTTSYREDTKIKTIRLGHYTGYDYNGFIGAGNIIDVNLETLAQNDSTIWGGRQLENIEIGEGDGTKTEFALFWDEARLDKDKKVFVDGVEKTSGLTWDDDKIIFDTAPIADAVITATYYVDYLPKDNQHVVDVDFSFTFNEHTPA